MTRLRKVATGIAFAATVAAGPCRAADIYARLFPFGFPDEAGAVSGCARLMEPSDIALASKGALVYMNVAGRLRIVPHKGVGTFTRAITDPGDSRIPPTAALERRYGERFTVLASRAGSPGRGAVRCWFWPKAGAIRLVSIEVVLPYPGSISAH